MPSPTAVTSELFISAQALLWAAGILAATLCVGAWCWWRQRGSLRLARSETHALQRQLRQLQDRHTLLSRVAHKLPLVPYRCEAKVAGAVLFVGESIEVLTGWPADSFMREGKRLDDIVHPDDLHRLREQLAHAAEERQGLRFECRLLHRDGRCFWVQGHSELRRTPDGQHCIEGAFLNIDEREQLHSALIASIRGVAYRRLPDQHWTVVVISDLIEELSGWSPADYRGSPNLLREFVHADDRPAVQQQIEEAIAEGRRFTLEYRAQHRDGRTFWVWEQGSAVRSASGEVLWLDGVLIDISERKALEIALREAKDSAEVAAASKTMFLSNMGHELRTPLNAIIGFSEIVLKTSLDAMQREHVYKVRQAARTLLRLVNDILDMAKLERGALTLEHADFSLRELAHEALQAQRAAADKKGLALQLDADPALADFLRGDARRVRQVLDKLLDNAVKFTERGTVRLELGRHEHLLLLAVHDTGIGIAPERQAKIFEPFAQVDPSMRRRHGGIGLGISIAQQLVEHMGGSINVSSEPGAGSCFRVLLPLEPAASGTTSQPLPLDVAPARPDADALLAPRHAPDAAGEVPTLASLRQAVQALRSGDHGDATLPELLHLLRAQGLTEQAARVEHALALFDLDLAAELLETVPARL